jgi:hypothetical protein
MDAVAGTTTAADMTAGLLMILIVFVSGFMAEGFLRAVTDKDRRFKTLVDYTAGSEDSSITIRQNPSYSDAIPIGASVNERTGIEFSYSFYMFVMPSTFNGEQVLKHVFHKGYAVPWPLMAPGVFVLGNTNTLRVFMNTAKNPYTYVDVRDIPVQKWFHVVLNCFKGGLDVYINGTLTTRIPFAEDIPSQNFQDLIFFSQSNYTFRSANIAALPEGETMEVRGAFSGYVSSVKYARYALSINEISKLMVEGPSAKRKSADMSLPPYLADSWWAAQR